MKSHPLEKKLKQNGFKFICGLDEAGRGPWAGPLVAAAVILPVNAKLPGLNDSKKVSPEMREKLFWKIHEQAIYNFGIVSHHDIDNLGLLKATKLAFEKALEGLPADRILIDGKDGFCFHVSTDSIIKGDTKVRCIAAASIVAKFIRDRMMTFLDKDFPEYQFRKHKGYGTRLHQEMLERYGVSEVHRKSYAPIRELLDTQY